MHIRSLGIWIEALHQKDIEYIVSIQRYQKRNIKVLFQVIFYIKLRTSAINVQRKYEKHIRELNSCEFKKLSL
ncbi:hypothetical protein DWY28_14480 [Ruminococcus sp. AF24-32LB]|jgi:predicted subunit of tRNA(5-methylaminomethyl-2-thiouridylate) methyltransferase|nr:hypothetical protein DWY28_14480 [Ruminococcus sp. AF24-32LB]